MQRSRAITTVLIDIGGVLLTNGWDRQSRLLAAKKFRLDVEEMEHKHHLTSDVFELGKITLTQYLDRIIFYQKRPFTRAQFQKFMYSQSKPFPEMLNLVRQLKTRNRVKIGVLSNESKEINEYRVKKFKLNCFTDFFISSSTVHLRKPDEEIYHLALDVAQTKAEQALYIENTPMFVEVAQTLGIQAILHTNYPSTLNQLKNKNLIE